MPNILVNVSDDIVGILALIGLFVVVLVLWILFRRKSDVKSICDKAIEKKNAIIYESGNSIHGSSNYQKDNANMIMKMLREHYLPKPKQTRKPLVIEELGVDGKYTRL